MKKITLFIALLCSLSGFSTRYLVQGTTGTNTWRTATSGEVNVTTSNFRNWYSTTFTSGYVFNAADEIWLAGGTYGITANIGMQKVSIYGGFAGTETTIAARSKVSGGNAWEFTTPSIIDGGNVSTQGISTSNADITNITYIDGVTITRCKKTGATAAVYGVGANITKGWTIQNCIISNNTATDNAAQATQGAGIYLAGGQVLNSYIVGNQNIKGTGTGATAGGGIAFAYTSATALNTVKGCTLENNVSDTYGGGIELLNGTGGTIEDCIFKTNSCTLGSGGGLGSVNAAAAGVAFTLKNCQFIENTSAIFGGGAELLLYASSSISVEGCSFIGNTGVNVGGLICRTSGTYSPIKNCIFRDNKSTTTAGTGVSASAFYSGVANTILQNCIFANNSSASNPTNRNYTISLGIATSKLLNCTVVNNSDAGAATGYTLFMNGVAGSITNCVFWGNVNVGNFAGVANAVSNYNATTPDRVTTGSGAGGTTGNIITLTVSPNNTFVTPTTFTGAPTDATQKAASAAADWRMKIGSPAINSGTDLAASGVTADILGNTRPTGASAVDRGAYEAIVVPGANNISALTTTTTTDLTIPASGHLTIDATKTLGSITVERGGKLTNTSGETLTLTTLNLKSDASGTGTYVEDNGGTSVITTAKVQQYLTGGRNWYITSPVASSARSVITNASNVYKYDEASATWLSESTSFSPLRGYIASATSTGTVTFTGGTLNTGIQAENNLTWSATDVSKKGYNLVGNPYPSYLDWEQATKTGLLTTIWYRSRNAGNTAYVFDTYNATSHAGTSLNGTTVTQYIPPMQAFWVRATSATNTLSFTNAMRSHESGTNRLKAKSTSSQQIIRLRVSNNVNQDESILLFNENALNSYDDYDSPKKFNNSIEVPEIFTQADNEKLVINSMNKVLYETEIPLGFSTLKANDFSIYSTEMSNFESGTKLILKDKLLNTLTELEVGTSYNFSSEITEPTISRFSLILRAPGGTTDLNNTTKLSAQVFVNSANQITIIAPENTAFCIFNSLGQKQYTNTLNTSKVSINRMFGSGVYFVELSANGQRITQKVVIR